MKYAEFILIYFILSFPAHSDNSRDKGAYINDSKTQCKVYDDNPNPNKTIKWTGDCKNGFADGFGMAQWYANNILHEKWTGFFIEGIRQRHRIEMMTSDESKVLSYEGNYPPYSNGLVRLIYKNLEMLANYENGEIKGNVKIKFKDGRLYIGEIANGAANGLGYFLYPDTSQYMGSFIDGKRNGWGVLRGPVKYQGMWKNDKFHGRGVLFLSDSPSGMLTLGNWVNGELEGDNIVNIYSSGDVAVGNYYNGRWTSTGLAPSNSIKRPVLQEIKPPKFDFQFISVEMMR